MFGLRGYLRIAFFAIVALFIYSAPSYAQCAPLGGVGSIQFLDQNAKPLTAGVLYVFTAGTSTQAPNYSDYLCTQLNPNPVPFGSGGRVTIWLATGTYKLVLCLQNDGPVCAPGDILFSVDQVPAFISSGGGGGGGAPFISNSANPATSGILRLASGDSICWRNAGNSANLCVSKDSNDLLTFFSATKYPESGTPACSTGNDVIWGDATAHRFKMCNNNGSATQLVASGQDINTSDFVTQLHFGATPTPLSGTAPTTGQLLEWNGTNIVGVGTGFPQIVYNTASAAGNASLGTTTMATVGASSATYRMNWYMDLTAAGSGCTGATNITLVWTWTDPQAAGSGSMTLNNITIAPGNGAPGANNNWNFTGLLPSDISAFSFRAKAGTNIQYSTTYNAGTNCAPGPSYQIFPILEQLTAN